MPLHFWDDIEKTDLPDELREIAEELGMEAAHHLVERWGGMQIYIPSRTRFEKLWREKRIREEFNGRNSGDLAARYDVSRNYVLAVVRGDKPDQGSLF